MSGYKVDSYIGNRLAKEVFREKLAHIFGYNEFYLSEKERLDTGKDSLRWKYPPNYFDWRSEKLFYNKQLCMGYGVCKYLMSTL